MDDDTSMSSSGPPMLTPGSSMLSLSPQPDLLLQSPAGTTDLRTLESARESVAWLSGQIVWAIERVLQARRAGNRAHDDDVWVINEAGALMARLVPHMEDTSGTFSLDGGQLPAFPYPGWPTPLPPGWADYTDQSALARQRMEVFSSDVAMQLESAKREQRQRLQSSLNDFEDEMITSIVPRKKQKQQQQPQRQWHRPLVVNGSTPYQKTTETSTSASEGGAHAPEQQQNLPEPQQQQPICDAFNLPLTAHRHTPAGLSSRTAPPPPPTTTGAASPSSTSPSPSHSIVHASRIQAPDNTPTLPAHPFLRSTPPQPGMSPPPPDMPIMEHSPTAPPSSSHQPRSPSPQRWGDQIPGLRNLFPLQGEPGSAYGQNQQWAVGPPYRPSPPRPYGPERLSMLEFTLNQQWAMSGAYRPSPPRSYEPEALSFFESGEDFGGIGEPYDLSFSFLGDSAP
ncbi:hypothetical protein INS49_009365 [Diaporthe citri]|uniref:uncharacterized protein n=1 Tax=Diaporthe citri TaxID=83186 RepID=UPI001C7FC5BB|nr:uncharacterized protein INS49_009365 [Diaporthe citri]KAG6361141.1 hypothetical protein INS49_009365 [Diaporthe citri]